MKFLVLFVKDTTMTLYHEDDSMTSYIIENGILQYSNLIIDDHDDIEYDSEENMDNKRCTFCDDMVAYEDYDLCFNCLGGEDKGYWSLSVELEKDNKYDHLFFWNTRRLFLNFLFNSLMINDYYLSSDEIIIKKININDLYNNNNKDVLNAIHNNYHRICSYL
jgi:hypothetical protein